MKHLFYGRRDPDMPLLLMGIWTVTPNSWCEAVQECDQFMEELHPFPVWSSRLQSADNTTLSYAVQGLLGRYCPGLCLALVMTYNGDDYKAMLHT